MVNGPGSIPAELGQMTALRELHVDMNQLTGKNYRRASYPMLSCRQQFVIQIKSVHITFRFRSHPPANAWQ